VNNPIKLNIYSNSCPDLTLIDLPGITRIPIHGKI
jgi:dynamin 1-like protein